MRVNPTQSLVIALFSLTITLSSPLTHPAAADTLTRKDGKTFHGRVVSTTESTITFEMKDASISYRMQVARSDIKSLERDAVYFARELSGKVGEDFNAADVQGIFQSARENDATFVVLSLNLDGGKVDEAAKIVTLIGQTTDLQVVALVDHLSGAGAAIGLACKNMVMQNSSILRNADSTPELTALLKKAAEQSGYSSVLATALAGRDQALSIVTDGKKKELVLGHPAGSTVLRREGDQLMLRSRDVVDTGIAAGIAGDPSTVGRAIHQSTWRDYRESGTVKSEMKPLVSTAKPATSSRTSSATPSSATPSATPSAATPDTPTGPRIYTSGRRGNTRTSSNGSSRTSLDNSQETIEQNRINNEIEINNRLNHDSDRLNQKFAPH